MAAQKFQTGFRLVKGEQLNQIVDRVNGTVAGIFKGLINPTLGITAAGGFGLPRTWHTGEVGPPTTTTGTDTTPVVTEMYMARVFVPVNTTITGAAILNGSAVAGNMQVALYSSAGALLASSVSTAQAGTAAYQQVPFSATYAALGPATYFIAVAFNNTGARFRTHILGNFVAGKTTGQTFGTLPATVTIPTGFTTGLGPIADTY